MKGSKIIIITLLLLFLFAFGCIEKSTPLTQKKAVLESSASQDIDGDGIPNEWIYEFKLIEQNGLRIKREISVRGIRKNPDFIMQDNYRRNEDASQDYYDQLTNIATITPNCIYAIDEVVPCDTAEECVNICRSKVRCNNGLNKYPSLNNSLYQFSIDLQKVKKGAASLRATIASSSYVTEPELDNIMLERDALSADIDDLLSNSIFENALCSKTEFSTLRLMLDDLESIYALDKNRSAQQFFNAYAEYKILSKTSYSFDENAVVELDELIPESFAKVRADINFLTPPKFVSASAPFVARYMLDFKRIEQTKADFAYEASAGPANWDEEMKSITYPSGTVKVLQLESFGPYVQIRELFYGILGVLRQNISFGFAVSITTFIFLLSLYLLIVLLRTAAGIFVSMSRHEPLKEALYRIAGYGGKGRKELFALAVIALAAGGYLITSAGEPVGEDIIQLLSSNTNLLLGTLIFSVGLFSLYFLSADAVKGILLGERYFRPPLAHGIRKVLVEKDLRAETRKMRKDIMSLKEAVATSGVAVDIKRIDEFLTKLAAAEQLISKGKLEDAELMMEKYIRNAYAALHEQLSVTIDQEKLIEEIRKDVEDEIDQIEVLYRKASAHDIKFKRRDWRSEANKYSHVFSSEGFSAAKKYMGRLMDDIRRERNTINSKIAEIEHLKLAKFACPVCNRMTSLASDTCENCGISLQEGFGRKLTDLRHELDSVASELRDKKVSKSERLISSVDVLMSHLDESIKSKKFNESAELISTIEEKVRHLEEVLSKTVSMEVELTTYVSDIGKRIETLPQLFEKANEAGIDVSSYEKRFNSLGGRDAVSRILSLSVDEALAEAKGLAGVYNEIEADVKNLIARYTRSINALERVNELFTEASTQITMAKGLGINVNDYSKRLEALNIEGLITSIENNEVDMNDLENTVKNLSDMVAELKQEVNIGKKINLQLKAIESNISFASELVQACKEGGLHPFEEMEQLYSIDLDSIKDRIYSLKLDDADSISSSLVSIGTKVSGVLARLRKKKDVLAAWPAWKNEIENLLRKQDRIEPAMLTHIPPEWRPWVVERFVGETSLPVVLEGNAIVKLKSLKGISKADLDKVLLDMIRTGRIIGGVILRKDGLVISSNLPEGRDASAVAAMSARAMQKAEAASTALDKGDVNYVVFNAKEGKQVIVKAGEQSLIIAIIKPEEDLGFAALIMKKAADKVKDLIGKL